MADTAPDDWIVPDQKKSTGTQAAGGDDWILPDEPKKPLSERLHDIGPAPLKRIEAATTLGTVEGSAGPGLPESLEKLGQDIGVLHTPGQPFLPTQAITDFALRAPGRVIGAAVGAATEGVGQVARELGASEGSAQQASRDVGGMAEYELIKPETHVEPGAAPPTRLSTPEEINAFLRKAYEGQPVPKSTSKTRAEIDEFLAQQAARETAAGGGPRALPPPDDWIRPAEPGQPPPQPAAPAAPAAAAPAGDFPDLAEPGRTAPPATVVPPGYIEGTFRVESRNGQAADRPGSQYQGLAQFGARERARYGITDPHSVEQNTAALIQEAEENSRPLSRVLGRAPDAAEYYLAHQQGLGGAVAQLQNPDQPAWQNLANTAEGRAKGPNWAKQAIWGNLPASVKARYGSVDDVSGADFVAAVRGFYENAPGSHAPQTAQTPATPEQAPPRPVAEGPNVLKALMEDERPADQIRAEGMRPAPPIEMPAPRLPPEQHPDLGEIMNDPRTADELRADLQAHKNFAPSNEWQPVPRPTPGAKLPDNLEYMHGPNEQVLARIPQPVRPLDPVAVQALPPAALTPRIIKADILPPRIRAVLDAAGVIGPDGLLTAQGLEALKAEITRRATPTPGVRENPVTVEAPADVHAGAELTALPSPAQAEAGNYQKRHLEWNGLPLSIETEAGGQRKGIGPGGKPWSVTLQHPYGYIKRTEGADGEQVDFYLGPHPDSGQVYVVDQINPATGKFDEHKALIGFRSATAARAAYEAGFSDQSGRVRLGDMARLTVAQFKDWLSKGDQGAPLAYSAPVEAVRAAAEAQGINPSAAVIEAAGQAVRVSDTDPIKAIVTAADHQGLAASAEAMEDARKKGLGDAWTTNPAAADETGERPAAPGEQAAANAGEAPAETAPGVVGPGASKPDRGGEPGAGPGSAGSRVEPEPAEPKLSSPATQWTTLDFLKLAKEIADMDEAKRATTRETVDRVLARMTEDGKKISDHCLETGSRFSVRG